MYKCCFTLYLIIFKCDIPHLISVYLTCLLYGSGIQAVKFLYSRPASARLYVMYSKLEFQIDLVLLLTSSQNESYHSVSPGRCLMTEQIARISM